MSKIFFYSGALIVAVSGLILKKRKIQKRCKHDILFVQKMLNSGDIGRNDLREIEKIYQFKEVRDILGSIDFKDKKYVSYNMIPQHVFDNIYKTLIPIEELKKEQNYRDCKI